MKRTVCNVCCLTSAFSDRERQTLNVKPYTLHKPPPNQKPETRNVSLSNAKLAEDPAKQVFSVGFADDLADRLERFA